MRQFIKQTVSGAILLGLACATAAATDYSFRMYAKGVTATSVQAPPPPPKPARTWPTLAVGTGAYDESTGVLRQTGSSGWYAALQFDKGVTSGKHYYEMTYSQHSSGACSYLAALHSADGTLNMKGYFCNNAAFPTIGVVLDMDTSPPTAKFLYQGQLSPSSGTIPATMTSLGFNLQTGAPAAGQTVYPGAYLYLTQQITFNFGQRPWVNTPPSGYEAGWAP